MNYERSKMIRKKYRDFISKYLSSRSTFDIKIPKEKIDHFCTRIGNAIDNGETIFVFGDYDPDGVCSTTHLIEAVELLAKAKGKPVKIDQKIPTRAEHYGIKYDEFLYYTKKFDLIITTDNGTHGYFYDNLTEEDFKKLLIVDHHPLINDQVDMNDKAVKKRVEKFQSHVNVINPNVDGTVKISTGLISEVLFLAMREQFPELKAITKPTELSDLAAITLISDMADRNNPIVRKIIKNGLERINDRERAMYKYLFPTFNAAPKEITMDDIGFLIAPLLNSGTRMSNKVDVLVMLMKEKEGGKLFKEMMDMLIYTNEIRKEATDIYTKAAEEEVKKILETSKHTNILAIKQDECPIGINGLISGNIASKFGIPTIMVSENIYGEIKDNSAELLGSGRGEGIKKLTAEVVSIANDKSTQKGLEVADTEEKEAANFGGHKMAIGITIHDWESFNEALSEFNEKPYEGLILSKNIVFNEEPLEIEEYLEVCKEYEKIIDGISLTDNIFAKVKARIIGFNEYRNNFKKIILSQENSDKTLELITKAPESVDLLSLDEVEIAIMVAPGNSEEARFADIMSMSDLRPDEDLIMTIPSRSV